MSKKPKTSTAPTKTQSKTKPKTKVPASTPITPSVVTTTAPVISAPELRKADLVEAVTTRTGFKRKDVKPVLDALLVELGDALDQDRDWNLPPFAKLKVKKVKDLPNGRVTMARLRRPGGPDTKSAAQNLSPSETE